MVLLRMHYTTKHTPNKPSRQPNHTHKTHKTGKTNCPKTNIPSTAFSTPAPVPSASTPQHSLSPLRTYCLGPKYVLRRRLPTPALFSKRTATARARALRCSWAAMAASLEASVWMGRVSVVVVWEGSEEGEEGMVVRPESV